MVIVVWLIGMVIFFFILHSVIRSAIDSSKMAANLQEIRDSMLERRPASGAPGSEELAELCPGCGSQVRPEHKYCPICSLKLQD